MPTFHIGLTMAGAISAGAYTAGAFDFLMQALEEWEKEKTARRGESKPPEQWDVPSHDVIIPVMSGASAGGITGALGVIALAEATGSKDPSESLSYPRVGKVITTLPRLYRAWVRMPAFVSPGGNSDLLGKEDIQASIRSLLDTTVLDKIVAASLADIQAIGTPRRYIAEPMHLFQTHTNLRGIPYEIEFTGGLGDQPGYPMMCHADRVHYRVHGIGVAVFQSSWVDAETATQINVADLQNRSAIHPDWAAFANAAVGSGAFPVGLRAREITGVTVQQYQQRRWPIRRYDFADSGISPEGQKFQLFPKFPQALGDKPTNRVDYVTVDGGMTNNEPFELARWTLLEKPPRPNPRDAALADRAVIMIDPFPELPDYESTARLDTTLLAVIKALMPAFINQARFKPNEMADALDETIYSRFLIAPRRRASAQGKVERYAIACGLLGGFGGFLSEEFRAHDYQLGRFNCYWFLKESFALPANNVVLKDGYSASALANTAFQASNPDKNVPSPFHQIIPLVGRAALAPLPPSWPWVDQAEVEGLVARAKLRADAVFKKMAETEIRSRVVRWGLQAAWSFKGKSAFAEFVRWIFLKNLILRDQLKEWQNVSADERKVAAALADPQYDFRTIDGIANQWRMDSSFVSLTIEKFKAAGRVWRGGEVNGNDTYTLTERKPSLLDNALNFVGANDAVVD